LLSVSSPYDDALVRGVEALKKRNVPVIVGVRWQLDSDQPPTISPALSKHVRFGSPGVDVRNEPWILHLAVRRGLKDARPNLVLEAFAAAQHPDARAEYILDEATRVIEIRYWEPDSETSIGRRTKYASEFVPVSQAGPLAVPSSFPEIRPGDEVFGYYTSLPGDQYLDESTIDVVDLFRGRENTLSQLAGRILVLGTARKGDRDIHRYDDRPVAGVHGVAAGIESLVNQRFVRLPSQSESLLIPMLAASLGAIAACLPFSAGRKVLLVVVVLVAILGGCIVIFRTYGLFIDAPIPVLSVLMAFLLASTFKKSHSYS
jgi:hypothetical protein